MNGFDPKEIESKIITAKIFLKNQSSDFKKNFHYIENYIKEEVRLIESYAKKNKSIIPEIEYDSIKNKKASKKGLPLKAERKIRINSDEGTWISLDVSPDGKNIAFDMLGDLYIMSISGGKAKRISSGMAFD